MVRNSLCFFICFKERVNSLLIGWMCCERKERFKDNFKYLILSIWKNEVVNK